MTPRDGALPNIGLGTIKSREIDNFNSLGIEICPQYVDVTKALFSTSVCSS
jgi:hypothetical protein